MKCLALNMVTRVSLERPFRVIDWIRLLVLAGIVFSHTAGAQIFYVQRSALSAGGLSSNVRFNASSYTVQQSVGQASAIGLIHSPAISLRQGFLQPYGTPGYAEVPSTQLMVFPNPFSDHIIVEFTDDVQGDGAITIVDILGRNVFSSSIKLERRVFLSPGLLCSGHYILQVIAGQRVHTVRIVRE